MYDDCKITAHRTLIVNCMRNRLKLNIYLLYLNHGTKAFQLKKSFKSSETAFETARADKVRKYTPLSDWFTSLGYSASVSVFVVGSLGAWDSENDDILHSLSVGYRYSTKLCVSDAIKGYNNIIMEDIEMKMLPVLFKIYIFPHHIINSLFIPSLHLKDYHLDILFCLHHEIA